MHPVMCVFVLIFMIFFSFYRVQWTGISLYWLQLFYVPTTELEGLLWYPVIFTGSLQGRITTQGDPCNLYRERVCSVFQNCIKIINKVFFLIKQLSYDFIIALSFYIANFWTSLWIKIWAKSLLAPVSSLKNKNNQTIKNTL